MKIYSKRSIYIRDKKPRTKPALRISMKFVHTVMVIIYMIAVSYMIYGMVEYWKDERKPKAPFKLTDCK